MIRDRSRGYGVDMGLVEPSRSDEVELEGGKLSSLSASPVTSTMNRSSFVLDAAVDLRPTRSSTSDQLPVTEFSKVLCELD